MSKLTYEQRAELLNAILRVVRSQRTQAGTVVLDETRTAGASILGTLHSGVIFKLGNEVLCWFYLFDDGHVEIYVNRDLIGVHTSIAYAYRRHIEAAVGLTPDVHRPSTLTEAFDYVAAANCKAPDCVAPQP